MTKPITNWDALPVIMDAVMVARLLGCSEARVRVYARDGTIPAYRVGKMWRFDRDEVKQHFYSKMKI